MVTEVSYLQVFFPCGIYQLLFGNWNSVKKENNSVFLTKYVEKENDY